MQTTRLCTVRRVLDRLQMAGRMASKTKFTDRCGPIGQEPLLEGWVAPGAGDDCRAALRPDLVAIQFDPGVDRCRVEELLLGQQALESFGSQRRFGGQMCMQARDESVRASLNRNSSSSRRSCIRSGRLALSRLE